MLKNEDVFDEGFIPLKKTLTSGDKKDGRSMSFNASTGESESLQAFWESSSWAKLERNKGWNVLRPIFFID
jgi:hypothetical protein